MRHAKQSKKNQRADKFMPIYSGIRMALGITIQKRRKKQKGRSLKTYQSKIKKVEKWYNRTFKNSENKNGIKKSAFCIKYSTLEKFLKVNKIKKASSK